MSQDLLSAEIFDVQGLRATKADEFQHQVAQRSQEGELFKVADSVSVVHGTVFTAAK